MYEYYVSDALARLSIILGIVVSTIIYKRTGMTLGGVIVCGYLALFIGQPTHIIVTLVLAFIAYQIVHNILKKRYMLNGRKLFEIEILVGLILQVICLTIIRVLKLRFDVDLAIFYGIGFVLPGVIAHDMGRQGPKNTLGSILLGVFVVSLIVIPLLAIEQVIPPLLSHLTSLSFRTQPNSYSYPLSLLPFGIIVSVLLDLIAYSKFGVRSGGFVTAAYLAIFAWLPWAILFVVIASILTYVFVQFITSHVVLAFGRTKLGIMVLSGVVIAWLLEILVINLTNGRFVPWSGFVVIMPMIVSLLANEYERQGPVRTAVTTTLSAVGVLLVMLGVVYIIHLVHLDWLFLIS
jgi:poly-gamma-glutamate biosynthesis protein PgsC/CapC